jgi:protein SCO1/2
MPALFARQSHPSRRTPRRPLGAWSAGLAGLAVAVALCVLPGCTRSGPPWHLTNVRGHLPDLDFSLVDDAGRPVTGKTYLGDTTLVYFGYTHCPDVCPETLARLVQVMGELGPDAKHVRILFISVDPARDTPAVMHAYVDAFDAQHAVGLTGTAGQIRTLAREYRVAYQFGKPDASGNYEVTHSSAIYVFDARGRARLLATGHDTSQAIAADLRRIIGADG